jgi:hypothetical protein
MGVSTPFVFVFSPSAFTITFTLYPLHSIFQSCGFEMIFFPIPEPTLTAISVPNLICVPHASKNQIKLPALSLFVFDGISIHSRRLKTYCRYLFKSLIFLCYIHNVQKEKRSITNINSNPDLESLITDPDHKTLIYF